MKECVSKRIDQCKQLIEAMGCRIDWTDNYMMSADYGLWQIYIDENCPNDILVSFHVNTCPWKAADISKRFTYLASLFEMNVIIDDVYAFEFDESGKLIEITFGEDAYETVGREHYYGFFE